MTEKQLIQYKIMNSIDFYSTAVGKYEKNNKITKENEEIYYVVDVKNRMGYQRKINSKDNEDSEFVFKDGKVVDFMAKKGYEVLNKLFANDEGARYLGEIALVQNDSPISNTGILFNNTLFDENASVHFAFGNAYSYAMKNGSNMTQSELVNKGANSSLIHVDFMVGGPELDITAYEKDGTEVRLFRNGNWVL
jgi:aminopeptidase